MSPPGEAGKIHALIKAPITPTTISPSKPKPRNREKTWVSTPRASPTAKTVMRSNVEPTYSARIWVLGGWCHGEYIRRAGNQNGTPKICRLQDRLLTQKRTRGRQRNKKSAYLQKRWLM